MAGRSFPISNIRPHADLRATRSFRPRSHGTDDDDHAGRMNTEHHAGTSYSGAIASPTPPRLKSRWRTDRRFISSRTRTAYRFRCFELLGFPSKAKARATISIRYPLLHTSTERLCPPRSAVSSIFAIQISARVCRLQPPKPAHERDIDSPASIPAVIVYGMNEIGRPPRSYFDQADLVTTEKSREWHGHEIPNH